MALMPSIIPALLYEDPVLLGRSQHSPIQARRPLYDV